MENIDRRGYGWDLDKTIIRSRRVREGFKDFLERTRHEGHQHFVVTGADDFIAQRELEMYSLEKYFEYVYSKNFHKAWGKVYVPIAEYMGFTTDDALQKIISIGDSESDMPSDIPLLFILDRYFLRASIMEEIINGIYNLGVGNYQEGFSNLLSSSQNSR